MADKTFEMTAERIEIDSLHRTLNNLRADVERLTKANELLSARLDELRMAMACWRMPTAPLAVKPPVSYQAEFERMIREPHAVRPDATDANKDQGW